MSTRAIHISIAGRVQGVGFRAWTRRKASDLGLSGWVRNRRDGTVEALFSGENEAVEAMLDACRRGPALARVDAVHIVREAAPVRGAFALLPTE